MLTLELENAVRNIKVFSIMQWKAFLARFQGNYIVVNPSMAKIVGYDTTEDFIAAIHNFKDISSVCCEDRDVLWNNLVQNGEIKEMDFAII